MAFVPQIALSAQALNFLLPAAKRFQSFLGACPAVGSQEVTGDRIPLGLQGHVRDLRSRR